MALPTSSGSVANRNDSALHGLILYARHARATAAGDTLIRAASSLVDQHDH